MTWLCASHAFGFGKWADLFLCGLSSAASALVSRSQCESCSTARDRVRLENAIAVGWQRTKRSQCHCQNKL